MWGGEKTHKGFDITGLARTEHNDYSAGIFFSEY